MLVLSRQRDQSVVITVPPSDKPQEITVTVVDIRGDKVRLGFAADASVPVHRKEVWDTIRRENRPAGQTGQTGQTGPLAPPAPRTSR